MKGADKLGLWEFVGRSYDCCLASWDCHTVQSLQSRDRRAFKEEAEFQFTLEKSV